MSNFKTATNLSKGATEYSRHYGNFRGVDFSNDHTQINNSRLAYLVNMYKDYQSGQGEALETIAGFRRRADFSNRPTAANGLVSAVTANGNTDIYGIFYYKHKSGGEVITKVLVHSGTKLWLWHNYPNSINVKITDTITVPDEPVSSETVGGVAINTYEQVLPFPAEAIVSLETELGISLTESVSFNSATNTIRYLSSALQPEQKLNIFYFEGIITQSATPLYASMSAHKSTSFIFNNKLYILDGANYLVYDGFTINSVKSVAYVPTTWISLRPVGSGATNVAKEHEQRNILSPKFKNTFIADGTSTDFSLTENNIQSIASVKLYGLSVADNTYTVDLANGVISFITAPTAPQNTVQIAATDNTVAVMYEEGYAGIEITAVKPFTSIDGVTISENDISELVTKCTLATTYDGRVFVTGNPDYHNYLFYCGRNSTGYADPSYFGVLNYQQDGVGLAPITGIMCVADTLMILKSDTQQDSSVYFHAGADSSINLLPRIYPSEQGLSGLGCVGACCNFLDDPIFISRLGVEAVAQLSVRLERANEHRSRLVDAVLVNNNLSDAVLEEWGGYLCVLVDGKLFLADSRQRYADSTGIMQYEWYYIEGVGLYDGQYREYRYASLMPDELLGVSISHEGEDIPLELASAVFYSYENETKDITGEPANEPDANGAEENHIYDQAVTVAIDGVNYILRVYYAIHEVYDIYTNEVIERHAYLCEANENYTGGTFKKASVLRNMDDNLFFGTVNGAVCSFNFDKRDSQGEIPSQYYSFDGRTIFSGCATLMDNCQVPHLTKTTTKRSTVIKTKSFRNSAAKVKVRTNKKAYAQVARINNSLFSFEDADFTDFTFNTTEQSIFAIKEKEKQWVEKQYFIFSDEFMKPFALYSISFRYRIAGRIK